MKEDDAYQRAIDEIKEANEYQQPTAPDGDLADKIYRLTREINDAIRAAQNAGLMVEVEVEELKRLDARYYTVTTIVTQVYKSFQPTSK